jgi:hypothetical protein
MVTVSGGLALKPAVTVFAGLASKLVATVFAGLASKPVAKFSPVWPQNWWRRFLPVWPQNRWWVSRLSLKTKVVEGFPVWASKLASLVWLFGPQNHRDGFLVWASKPTEGGRRGTRVMI